MTEPAGARDGGPPSPTGLQRSSRDHTDLRRRLEAWLVAKLPAGAAPVITSLEGTSANGMSSETLLFDAAWIDRRSTRHERLVARVAPDPGDVPVFPSYDLDRQYRTIGLVDRLTSVPVPPVWWSEPDPAAIGAPFFVMGRVDGQVPPDVMPYNFGDSWLFDASPHDQRRLQDATVGVLAELHAIDRPLECFAFLAPGTAGATPLRRRVASTEAWYAFAAADGWRSPLIERAFAWLDEHWPADEGPAVVCWGDSRIGNVMYEDFTPVAVLDWEMASLGPRELDVAWLVYGHRIFEDIAVAMGLRGMPELLQPGEVAATYESLTGHTLGDLAFYGTYAALQYGIVFLRTGHRQVHFGEVELPQQVDDVIINREPLERMLAGSYWT
jgi:aminoglycoside phosphotransferase (APT) family kinase protein